VCKTTMHTPWAEDDYAHALGGRRLCTRPWPMSTGAAALAFEFSQATLATTPASFNTMRSNRRG
jgi:hypothetical protein